MANNGADFRGLGANAGNGNVIADSFQIGSTAITATATELNKLSGVTATTAEINKLAGLSTGAFIVGAKFPVSAYNIAAADVARVLWIAPAACKILSGYERHVTVAGQAGVLTVEKVTTGQAPGSGSDLFATGWDLTSTANTPVSKTAVTTAAGTLAAGDALCFKLQSGAATSYALGTVGITMQWV